MDLASVLDTSIALAEKQPEPVSIQVPDGASVEKPFEIMLSAQGNEKRLFQNRLTLKIGKNASAKVAVKFLQTGAEHFIAFDADIVLEEGAKLHFVSMGAETMPGTLFEVPKFRLGKDARLEAVFLSKGVRLRRSDVQVDFRGENASVSIEGLSLLSGETKSHIHTLVNHFVPNCESQQLFKGILTEKALSEYSGLIHVHKNAQLTRAQQSNPNLILSDDARALSRPQLRIDADDVKCGHGATTGKLDEHSIFYLRSRGLKEKAARALLLYSFAEEVIQKVQIKSVRNEFEEVVKRSLESVAEN
jgi:Fe-S cluster assembly protein SufD